jgi:glyoxylase-like metal-dependent hydrolase (beta-lactamase superfamily II)
MFVYAETQRSRKSGFQVSRAWSAFSIGNECTFGAATSLEVCYDALMFISYYRDLEFEYGRSDRVTPLVRRVVARNPSPFTFHGTGTYIVGHGNVAVIDPGPLDADHLKALEQALEGETVTHILVTHTHRDHSPAAAPLKEATGAPTFAFGPHGTPHGGPGVEEGADHAFLPDEVTADGAMIHGDGWTMEAVHTPGHTSNHLCYALLEEKALFSGDHVMGWSTTVVSQPDGDMADYMASLAKVLGRDERVMIPTHGPPITDPAEYVTALLNHRQDRETQILACLAAGPMRISQMVVVMYTDVPTHLHKAAGRSVHSHLIKMVQESRVISEGTPSADAVYTLP